MASYCDVSVPLVLVKRIFCLKSNARMRNAWGDSLGPWQMEAKL